MFTLILIGVFAVASCLAAAGLIASTQNNADAAAAMNGLEAGSDISV
ncbi:MAG: hypothetical protein WBA73_20495 [Devosia sp.]